MAICEKGVDFRPRNLFPDGSHQVVENTGKTSGIGQNNPNFGQWKGRGSQGENSQPVAMGRVRGVVGLSASALYTWIAAHLRLGAAEMKMKAPSY